MFKEIARQRELSREGSANIIREAQASQREAEINRYRPGGDKYRAGYRLVEQQNQIREQAQGIDTGISSQVSFTQQAETAARSRPGFYELSELGDLQTQRTLKGIEAMNRALELQGMPKIDIEAAAGGIIETQRQAAYRTPTVKDEQFYGTELAKWASRPIEKSAAYHNIGMRATGPVPENPFEMRGDLAVEFLKGGPHKPSERFSTVSGKMEPYLPSGQGLQETMWTVAVSVDKGRPVSKPVSYTDAVNVLNTSRGGLFTGEIGRPAAPREVVTIKPATQIGEPLYQQTVRKEPNLFGQVGGRAIGGTLSLIKGFRTDNAPQRVNQTVVAAPVVSTSKEVSVSGGNQTISELGTWIDTNKNRIDVTNPAEVSYYNQLVDTYNKMSKQNPIVTTEKTTTKTTQAITTGTMQTNPDANFLGGALKRFGIDYAPQANAISLQGDQQFAKVASDKFWQWFNPSGRSLDQIGASTLELYRSKVDSPVALAGLVTPAGKATSLEKALPWVIGGAAAVGMAANTQRGTTIDVPRFDLSAQAKRFEDAGKSIQSAGFNVFKAGVVAGTLAETTKQKAVNLGITKAQESWEGMGGAIQLPGAYNLPKIADVPPAVTYQAPGTGFGKQVDLPAIGFAGLIRAPGFGRDMIAKVSGAVAVPRPSSSGSNIGITEVIQMPKSTIEPSDVITPVYGYGQKPATIDAQKSIISDRAIFDLSVGSEAKATVKTRELAVNRFTYSDALSRSEARSNTVTTPFWWAKADYISRSAADSVAFTDGFISAAQGSTKSNITDLSKTLSQGLSQSNISSGLGQGYGTQVSNWWDNLTNNQGRWSPSGDLKLRLPNLWGGGSGSSGGGPRRKRRSYELFLMGLDLGATNPMPKFNFGIGKSAFNIGGSGTKRRSRPAVKKRRKR